MDLQETKLVQNKELSETIIQFMDARNCFNQKFRQARTAIHSCELNADYKTEKIRRITSGMKNDNFQCWLLAKLLCQGNRLYTGSATYKVLMAIGIIDLIDLFNRLQSVVSFDFGLTGFRIAKIEFSRMNDYLKMIALYNFSGYLTTAIDEAKQLIEQLIMLPELEKMNLESCITGLYLDYTLVSCKQVAEIVSTVQTNEKPI